MDRRNFFKIVSSVSAGAASIACSSHKSDALIPMLVPDHEIVPGEEQWRPSVCSACGAGCGVIVRVMRGERIIERNGEKFREPIACVKKIEGNPLDSVSGGRLCARGHAELQSIYNPDRLRGPMQRTGDRGKGQFTSISWDQAITEAATRLKKADPGKLLFLTSAQAGSRALAIQSFLQAIGSPAAANSSYAIERKAAEMVFGWKGLPKYDLANARYALGVGADFLGGWVSPVYYARQYGHFRQGRPGLRGKFVQAESRMSLTAASADEWLPVRPGAEPQLLMAIAGLLVEEKLTRNQDIAVAVNLEDLIRRSGVAEKKLRRIAKELGESEAPLVIGGASVVHTNSLDAVTASHYLNVMLGNVGKSGGIRPPTQVVDSTEQRLSLADAQVLLLDRENPVYAYAGVAGSMSAIETIISFGDLMDDSAAYADLILPDHHTLESESIVYPPVAGTDVAFVVSTPVVRPLYNTRALTQTLTDLAQKMSVKYEMPNSRPELAADESWEAVVAQGGLWHDQASDSKKQSEIAGKPSWQEATFAGDLSQYPLHFQPYPSLQYHDGSGANLPWLQELPDPVSSFMWGLPLEIDIQTAARLKVETGDWVRVKSPQGSLEAQVYVHPAALPGVVSMAIGGGHGNSGRYGSGRGVNPLSIVSPTFGATRVQVTRLEAKAEDVIQFSPNDREQGPWGYR